MDRVCSGYIRGGDYDYPYQIDDDDLPLAPEEQAVYDAEEKKRADVRRYTSELMADGWKWVEEHTNAWRSGRS